MFLGMCSAQLKYFKTYLLNSKFNTLKQQLQSSVELTRVFDRIDFYRSKQPSIELTRMRDIACEITNWANFLTVYLLANGVTMSLKRSFLSLIFACLN